MMILHISNYKKLKKEEIVSLTLRIKHVKNNIMMTDGPATTVVLHIRALYTVISLSYFKN